VIIVIDEETKACALKWQLDKARFSYWRAPQYVRITPLLLSGYV